MANYATNQHYYTPYNKQLTSFVAGVKKQQQPKLVGTTKPNFAQNIPQKQATGGEGFIKGLDTKGMVDLTNGFTLSFYSIITKTNLVLE